MFAQRPLNPIAMPARIIYLCLNKSTDDDVNDSMATGCSVEKLFWGQKKRSFKKKFRRLSMAGFNSATVAAIEYRPAPFKWPA
jgi:hypothetical protein